MIRAFGIFVLLSLLCGVGAEAQAELESHEFDSDGAQIHYVDEGSGEPVLLIHGFTADLRVNWVEVLVIPGASHGGAAHRPELLTGLLGFLTKHGGN